MRQITSLLYTGLGVTAILMILAPWAWYFDVVSNFVPQFAIAALVTFLLLLGQRRLLLATSLVVITFYLGWPLVSLWYPAAAETASMSTDATEETVTILQANTNYENTDPAPLLKIIEEQQPTIIALEEITLTWMAVLTGSLGEQYPYVYDLSRDSYQGMAILSKTPLGSVTQESYTNESPPVIIAELSDLDAALVVVHTLSPISQSWSLQRDQLIDELGTRLTRFDERLIVVGDLNTTMHSPIMHDFINQTELIDTRHGFGWKPSWLRNTPIAVAIDYILYKGVGIRHTGFSVLDDIGSDHWPILATLRIVK